MHLRLISGGREEFDEYLTDHYMFTHVEVEFLKVR